jgi:hypothetical protein
MCAFVPCRVAITKGSNGSNLPVRRTERQRLLLALLAHLWSCTASSLHGSISKRSPGKHAIGFDPNERPPPPASADPNTAVLA